MPNKIDFRLNNQVIRTRQDMSKPKIKILHTGPNSPDRSQFKTFKQLEQTMKDILTNNKKVDQFRSFRVRRRKSPQT